VKLPASHRPVVAFCVMAMVFGFRRISRINSTVVSGRTSAVSLNNRAFHVPVAVDVDPAEHASDDESVRDHPLMYVSAATKLD
jgi:hypothetical protein